MRICNTKSKLEDNQGSRIKIIWNHLVFIFSELKTKEAGDLK